MATKLFPTIARLLKTLDVNYNPSYLKNNLKNELAIEANDFEIPETILRNSEEATDMAWNMALKELKVMMHVLDHYNIQTTVNGETDFSTITAPALVGIFRNSGTTQHPQISYSWLLLHEIKDGEFHLFDAAAGKTIMSLDEMTERATGVSVALAKTELSEEPGYKHNKGSALADRLGFFGLVLSLGSLFLLTGYIGTQSTTAFYSLFLPILVIKLIGLYLVFELKKVETSPANAGVLSKFCNLAEGYSCQSVLNSKGARILYGKIGLSSVGMVYFLGGILSVFLAIIARKNGVMNMLAAVTLLSLPFTIYSVVYQWRVVKKWCVLCLAVQLLLWMEFFVYFFNSTISFPLPDNTEVIILLFGFSVAGILSFFTVGYYKEKARLHAASALQSSWQRNTDIFKAVMDKAPALTDLPPMPIRMGSEAGKIEVLAVLGLHCNSCKNTFWELQRLANKRKDISLYIVLTLGDAPLLKDFIALASQNKHEEAAGLLTAWFELMEKTPKPAKHADKKAYAEKLYSKWKAGFKFDLKNNGSEISDQLKLQTGWLNKHNFSTVPIIFVNHKLWLMPPFQPGSIAYFFDEIEELNGKGYY